MKSCQSSKGIIKPKHLKMEESTEYITLSFCRFKYPFFLNRANDSSGFDTMLAVASGFQCKNIWGLHGRKHFIYMSPGGFCVFFFSCHKWKSELVFSTINTILLTWSWWTVCACVCLRNFGGRYEAVTWLSSTNVRLIVWGHQGQTSVRSGGQGQACERETARERDEAAPRRESR